MYIINKLGKRGILLETDIHVPVLTAEFIVNLLRKRVTADTCIELYTAVMNSFTRKKHMSASCCSVAQRATEQQDALNITTKLLNTQWAKSYFFSNYTNNKPRI